MNFLFIDSNIYLKFYHGSKLLKYLEILIDNYSNVIITDQIVDEVLRNSVSKSLSNWIETKNNLYWTRPNFLYYDISEEVKELIEKTEKVLRS